MINFAFGNSLFPQETKDIFLKTINAYKIIIKQVLDMSRIGYENMMKTVSASQIKAEQTVRDEHDRRLLQRYSNLILSL